MDYHTNYHAINQKHLGSSNHDSNNLNEFAINQCEVSDRDMFKQNNMSMPNVAEAQLTENCNIYHQTQDHGDIRSSGRVPNCNQRILEDLSYSRPIAVTTANDTLLQKSLQPTSTNRIHSLPTVHQEALPLLTLEQSRQAMYTIPGGISTSENNSTSIHISFSENHSHEEKEDEGENTSLQSGLNVMPHFVHGGGSNKVGSRSLRVHLHSDLAYVERTKLEKKRERNRLAASKCRLRKLEKIQTLEEQVDDLQGQIRKLTEHVMELKVENEELKSKVAMQIPHNTEVTQHSNNSYFSSNQLCNNNGNEITNNATGASSIINEDLKEGGLDIPEHMEIVASVGPDSTCLEMGDGV